MLHSGMMQVDVCVNGHTVERYTAADIGGTQSTASEPPVKCAKEEEEEVCRGRYTRPLSELAFIRSGDKGDTANIGKHSHKSMCVWVHVCTHSESTVEVSCENFCVVISANDGPGLG